MPSREMYGTALRLARAFLIPALMAASGCSLHRPVGEVSRFAGSGKQYSDAVDALLAETGDTVVDAESTKLLRNRGPQGEDALRSQLEAQTEADREYLEELRLVRDQTRLLRAYFVALGKLADTDAATAIKPELEATGKGLATIGGKLLETDWAERADAAGRISATLGGLIVKGVQRAALARELRERASTITRALLLQEILLEEIRADLTQQYQIILDERYERTVAAPYADAGSLETADDISAWKADRRETIAARWELEAFDAATKAAQELRLHWASLCSGELEPEDVASFADDLGETIDVIDAFRDLRTDPKTSKEKADE